MYVIIQHSDIAPGGWSSVGLSVEAVDDGMITCSSTHLTSFAVLVDVSGGSQVVIGYILIAVLSNEACVIFSIHAGCV